MDSPEREWTAHPTCCWCGNDFQQRTVDGILSWVCKTDACAERQCDWKLVDKDGRLIYLPMPKQVELDEAIAAQQYGAICIGGHRGGGKSKALRMIAYRYCQKIERFTVIFLRREWAQLKRNHMRFVPYEAKRMGATFASSILKFQETGAELEFSHCNDQDDYKNFIGAEADLVIFDQLELFTLQQYVEISAATSRTTRDGWRGLTLAGENPGGPLSRFVEDIFITKTLDREKYPDYDPTDCAFIASRLEDNPATDERYVKRLALLPRERREQFRYGRRDVFPDQYFTTWNADLHVRSVA